MSAEAIKFFGNCDKALASAALTPKAVVQDVEAAATMWLDKLKKVASTVFAGRAWPQPPWQARVSPPEAKGEARSQAQVDSAPLRCLKAARRPLSGPYR